MRGGTGAEDGEAVSPDPRATAEEITAGIDLSGRTAVVTGVNSGIGRETMRVLAQRGAHVIGTARTPERARDACAGVAGRTTPLALELGALDSVARCADEIVALGEPVDILVCNAGVLLARLEQVRGLEKHFAINHLGHFVLVNRLIERVCAAEQGRVVIVGSGAHRYAPPAGIEFDKLGGERHYSARRAYGQSKLANGLFARELARRLEGTRATANVVHPGVVVTDIARNLPLWQALAFRVLGPFVFKSVAQGAATSCYVATHPSLAHVSGCYFADCAPRAPRPNMLDDALAARLWQVSTELAQGFV